jgi:hypothetical protein
VNSRALFIKSDPACEGALDWMRFRLTYEGLLLGSSRSDSRAKHKHEIRRIFHRQLARLFAVHPAFDDFRAPSPERTEFQNLTARIAGVPMYERRLNEFQRCGYRFFPLAVRELSLLCSIHMLFLRPDITGGVIRSGDIDNRLKTVFDALRLPRSKEELGGYDTPAADEDPFFCLLEDDSLINEASIEADTLLQPTGQQWDANDVRLVITVSLAPYFRMMSNIAYG